MIAVTTTPIGPTLRSHQGRASPSSPPGTTTGSGTSAWNLGDDLSGNGIGLLGDIVTARNELRVGKAPTAAGFGVGLDGATSFGAGGAGVFASTGAAGLTL